MFAYSRLRVQIMARDLRPIDDAISKLTRIRYFLSRGDLLSDIDSLVAVGKVFVALNSTLDWAEFFLKVIKGSTATVAGDISYRHLGDSLFGRNPQPTLALIAPLSLQEESQRQPTANVDPEQNGGQAATNPWWCIHRWLAIDSLLSHCEVEKSHNDRETVREIATNAFEYALQFPPTNSPHSNGNRSRSPSALSAFNHWWDGNVHWLSALLDRIVNEPKTSAQSIVKQQIWPRLCGKHTDNRSDDARPLFLKVDMEEYKQYEAFIIEVRNVSSSPEIVPGNWFAKVYGKMKLAHESGACFIFTQEDLDYLDAMLRWLDDFEPVGTNVVLLRQAIIDRPSRSVFVTEPEAVPMSLGETCESLSDLMDEWSLLRGLYTKRKRGDLPEDLGSHRLIQDIFAYPLSRDFYFQDWRNMPNSEGLIPGRICDEH